MVPLIESLVDAFATRRLSRRELVASLTALIATGESASAQTPAVQQISKVAQGATINHISLAVTDVERSAQFYSKLLGLKEVSRPGNGGINLGLGTSFLGLYKLANPGTVNHCCIGVDGYDPVRIAASLKEMGVQARIDTNPANRTSGGDQLFFRDPDNTNVQLSANGFQG
jgi:catechol 2,3-dioxygenase-like lactoylglutathione lyase family enzyme